MTPLMKLFGSRNGDLLQYSKDYATYILIAAPFMCMCFVLNNILRAEGKPVLSMIGLIVGALINVVLDPLLIFVAGMQVKGAALAVADTMANAFAFQIPAPSLANVGGKSNTIQYDSHSQADSNGIYDMLRTLIDKLDPRNNGGGDIVIPVSVGGEFMEEIIVKAEEIRNYRSGGKG